MTTKLLARSAAVWWIVRREAVAFLRVFKFTRSNSDMEKTLLWFLLGVWSLITIGIAYGLAESTTVYHAITALVWALIGRVWGGEAKDVTKGGGVG